MEGIGNGVNNASIYHGLFLGSVIIIGEGKQDKRGVIEDLVWDSEGGESEWAYKEGGITDV